MKRPVFRGASTRDTNAPWPLVQRALGDAATWSRWCISPRAVPGPLRATAEGGLEASYLQLGPLGLRLEGVLRATPTGDRVLLEHEVAIRGWAILGLIGWYRWRIERVWERFVAALPEA